MATEETQFAIQSEDAGASLSMADVDLNPTTLQPQKSNVDEEEPPQQENETLDEDPECESDTFEGPPSTSSPRFRRAMQIMICVFCCIFVVMAGLVIGAMTRPLNESTPRRRPTHFQIAEWLIHYNISARREVFNASTAQHKAIVWLADLDSAALPLPHSMTAFDGHQGYMYLTRYVLALLYFSTDGHLWKSKRGFLGDPNVCRWNAQTEQYDNTGEREKGGLSCAPITNLPAKLDLEYGSLRGTLPTELGLLTTLEVLDFEFNSPGLKGTIPTELCGLPRLTHFAIRSNKFTGGIPSCFGNMPKLQHLWIGGNKLGGQIPTELCQLSNTLQALSLQRNELTGPIPDCFSDFKQLEGLYLHDNSLQGGLDPLVGLDKLKFLFVHQNRLSGDAASVLRNMVTLQELYLDDNSFTGNIDDKFLHEAGNLVALDLSNNNFTSNAFPAHLFRHPNIKVIDLSQNRLGGRIPASVPANNHTEFLSVHKNQFEGPIPIRLGNMKGLKHLDLSFNKFTGSLPHYLFQMSNLEILSVGENRKLDSGTIPEEIGEMKQLRQLSLKNTKREGPLPKLHGFHNLQWLDLDDNALTGSVPPHYSNLASLKVLMLNRNPGLNGSLPVLPSSLETVFLDGTAISGNLTPKVCGLAVFDDPSVMAINQMTNNDWMVVANCRHNVDANSTDNECACCHCCRPSETHQGACSDKAMDNLDWSWERRTQRRNFRFGVNLTDLTRPPEEYLAAGRGE